ncbi:putative malate dehydrogenase (decarboxylating) [Helianthus anomalus]
MSNFSRQVRLSSNLIRDVHYRISRSVTIECHRPTIIHKKGVDIIHNPWYNKGTAFSMTERDRLQLRGLLPTNVQTVEQQIDRFSKLISSFIVVRVNTWYNKKNNIFLVFHEK